MNNSYTSCSRGSRVETRRPGTTAVPFTLEQRRRLRGLIDGVGGQSEMHRRSGVARQTINALAAECGATPRLGTLLRLEDAAGVPHGFVLAGSETSRTNHDALPVAQQRWREEWEELDRRNRATRAEQSARAFYLAIVALPVGKDIRARLTVRLDDLISAIQDITT